jgi:osmotically-inducible protein OsmY
MSRTYLTIMLVLLFSGSPYTQCFAYSEASRESGSEASRESSSEASRESSSEAGTESSSYSGLGHPQTPGEVDYHTKDNLLHAINQNKLSEDAQHINITNANGNIILRGFVKDNRERMLISTLAHQNAASNIINELKIRPSNNKYKKNSQR